MPHYTYDGRFLKIAPRADVQPELFPGQKYSHHVQQLLDSIEPWSPKQRTVRQTMAFRSALLPMAVPTQGARVIWGIHRDHQASRPGLSPFVDRPVPANWLGTMTIELVGSPETPMLVRAYGGEYTPPLPWMMSARESRQIQLDAQRYWHSHAYLLLDDSLIRRGTRRTHPPTWFHS